MHGYRAAGAVQIDETGGHRRVGKAVWAVVVLLLLAAPLVASHNWVDIPDVGGLDDAVAQSDLTTMGFDGSHPGTFSVRWSWDKITFSGANTGDACMLFDTDGDGNINNSLCVQIATSGATTSIVSGFPVLFACGDARTDRCSTPAPAALGATTCTVAQVTTDPFAGGESYPNDMQAECAVPISALTGTPIFTTVCSYPSAGNGGNNNPVDCVASPGSIVADLQVTKSNGLASVVAGGTTSYTIVVSDPGPNNANGTTVTDPAAAGLTKTAVSCSAAGGAACPSSLSIGQFEAGVVIPTLPLNGTVTFTVTATVTATSGSVTNTATVTGPSGAIDPVASNDTASDTDTVTAPAATADLQITKTDGAASSAAGAPIAYTITASNAGPDAVTAATVTDTFPGAITGVTWTCTATAGSTCPASGTGDINAAVDLLAGGSATFTASGTVSAAATGTLSNTATIAAPAGVLDATPGNNSATDTNTITATADLAVTKTDGATSVAAGGSVTYTITASNAGPGAVSGATVTDTLPASLSGATWTCTASAGSSCPASGSGNLSASVNLLAGGSATFTLSATVSGSASGTLSNTASIAAPGGITDPTPANNSATDTTTVTAAVLTADLSITKTSTPNPYVAGATLTYTIVVANAGPAGAANARVQDALPAAIAAFTWTCSGSGGSTCATATGSGSIDALVTLPAGTAVTFTLTGTVPAGTTGPLSNTATVTPPAGVTDPSPGNQTATNVNTPLTSQAPTGVELELRQTFPQAATPGGLLTYTYTTTNRGPGIAQDLIIDGMLPAGTTFVSAAPGAGGTTSMVNGMFVATWAGPTLPGATRTVTLVLQVNPSAPAGSIVGSWFMTSSNGADPYHFNDMVDSYVFVGGAVTTDLVLTGEADAGTDRGAAVPVAAGATATLHLTVANAGSAAARGAYALILDEVGAFDVVEARASHGSLGISSAHSAVWETGSIAPASTATLDLVVRMVTTASARLLVMRTDGSPADPDATNDFVELTLDGLAAAPRGGRSVATGRLDAAPGREMLVGGGEGETPQVRIFNGAGREVGSPYYAYDRAFRGGVRLASCDVDGDGDDEIVTGQGPGGSQVRVLAYTGGLYADVVSFAPFEAGFSGGVTVSCADLDGNGRGEVVVGAGAGRAADVRVFSITAGTATQTAAFAAYESAFTGGVRVAATAFAGGSIVPAFHIITVPGPGRPTDIRAWRLSGASAVRVAEAALGTADGGDVSLGDADNDGLLDLVVTPEGGTPMQAMLYGVGAGRPIASVAPGTLRPDGGIRIALGDLGAGGQDIVVSEGAGGRPMLTVFRLTAGGATLRGGFLALEVP